MSAMKVWYAMVNGTIVRECNRRKEAAEVARKLREFYRRRRTGEVIRVETV